MDYRKYLLKANASLIKVMQQINDNAGATLYVVDDHNRLIGSVTDGDIRRWIINGGCLEACVRDFLFSRPQYILENNADKAEGIMKRYAIKSLPMVKADMTIIGVIFGYKTDEISNSKLSGIPVIIMAGGKGTRLLPITRVIPKPLMPICGIPIIDRIMDGFNLYGVDRFYLTVNYKKEIIKSYLTESDRLYSIEFIEEDVPLGTAGGISLIRERFESPVIITNCDVIVEIDYSDLIKYHIDSHNDITIISSIKTVPIPYGVLNIRDEGGVVSIEEKPTLSRLINTGIYVLNPEYIGWIPKGQKYHMTDLADEMIKKGKKVETYPVGEGAFYDMGEYEEMQRMEEHLKIVK